MKRGWNRVQSGPVQEARTIMVLAKIEEWEARL